MKSGGSRCRRRWCNRGSELPYGEIIRIELASEIDGFLPAKRSKQSQKQH
jgi:hypothetical protein